MEVRDIIAIQANEKLILVKYYNVNEGKYKHFFMTNEEFDKEISKEPWQDYISMAEYILKIEGDKNE